ncbi:hypothetical protein TGRUB_271450 [Toxoplasma gondii RUB]|uniref:Uncharacterized protein n=1 Tax=Toxoplasma gondii RUB TaxID=935652 RepID=A0A086LYL3_TOXGO|nr:hypothetical protein TGRUB_271450 [Toxoplasma gondii RUB]
MYGEERDMHIRERERGRDIQIERKMRKKEVLRIPQRCNRLGYSDSKQSPSFLFAFCSSFLKKTQTPIARHDCGTHSSPSTERQVHLFFGGSSSYSLLRVICFLLAPSSLARQLVASSFAANCKELPNPEAAQRPRRSQSSSQKTATRRQRGPTTKPVPEYKPSPSEGSIRDADTLTSRKVTAAAPSKALRSG